MTLTLRLFKAQRIDCFGRQQEALYGYYPCDTPPRIGFEWDGVNFDFAPDALKWKDDGANNCTAIITGHPNALFVLGNAFFQGKYVDFKVRKPFAYDVGWANLKNPADPGNQGLLK